jgi:D-alanine transaminase
MSRIVYVNGRYLPRAIARVDVEDRGYQFADGVYEVCEVRHGRLIDEARHLARLQRSLGELRIAQPMTLAALGIVLRETVRRNRVRDGIVYLQITRGVARRDFAFPAPATMPSVVAMARSNDPVRLAQLAAEGIAVITVPDIRWGRVDIKSVALLPNVLAKQAAREAGAFEAWFVDAAGNVTEGSSTNAWIVTADDRLVTRHADHGILPGITRSVLFDIVGALGLTLDERPFSVAEALAAREAFLSGSSATVLPIVTIDGVPVGTGKPGPIARRLRTVFHDHAETAPAWSVHRDRHEQDKIPG